MSLKNRRERQGRGRSGGGFSSSGGFGTKTYGRKRGNVEMYDEARFFTVTGRPLDGTSPTLEERQAELKALHAEIFGAGEEASANGRVNGTCPGLGLEMDDAGVTATDEK